MCAIGVVNCPTLQLLFVVIHRALSSQLLLFRRILFSIPSFHQIIVFYSYSELTGRGRSDARISCFLVVSSAFSRLLPSRFCLVCTSSTNTGYGEPESVCPAASLAVLGSFLRMCVSSSICSLFAASFLPFAAAFYLTVSRHSTSQT